METRLDHIEFTNTMLVERNEYPTEDGTSNVLVFETPLNPGLAEKLQCRDMLFNINDNPRDFKGSVGLLHKFEGALLKLPGVTGSADLYPDDVASFKIQRDEDVAGGFLLTWRAKFKKGYEEFLATAVRNLGKGTFAPLLCSPQGDLFPQPAAQDGTRVELSAGPVQQTLDEQPAEPKEDERTAATLPRLAAVEGRRKKQQSTDAIPTDPNVAEWRTADEVAAGVPHHIKVTQ